MMFYNQRSNSFQNLSNFANKNKIKILIVIVLVVYLISFVSFESNNTNNNNNNNTNNNNHNKHNNNNNVKTKTYENTQQCDINGGKNKNCDTINDGQPPITTNEISSGNIIYDAAIIVLGYSLHPDGMPTQILKERVILASEYYSKLEIEEGYNTKFIVSGKSKDTETDPDKEFNSEAEAMNEIALQNDVNPRDILIENNSTNTAENAALTLKYLQQHKIQKLFVVTSDFHLLRTQYIFQTIIPPTIELIFVGATTSVKTQKTMREREKVLFVSSKKDLDKMGALEIPGEQVFGYHPYRNIPRWRMIEREMNLDKRDMDGAKLADYGSNQGFFSIQMAEKFPDSTVFSFEGEAMNEYKSATVEHEEQIVKLGLSNNFLCKTRILPSMFKALAEQSHVYEYQLCLSIFHWFDMKTQDEFEDTLSNHLISSRTTFIELPEAMKYRGNEGQHAWNRVNIWYADRNEDEIFRDIQKKYNIPQMTWKTLGAILHENNTVRKLIRVDVSFEDDKRIPLTRNELTENIYTCGSLMHK